MNDKRFKEVECSSLDEMLCIGNKVRKFEYNGKIFYNVSLTKEIFRLRKKYKNGDIDYDSSEIISLSDFSNFHTICRIAPTQNDQFNKQEDGRPIVAHYKNLNLFTPLNSSNLYVAHLQPAYIYLGGNVNFEKVRRFVTKYNKTNLDSVAERWEKDGLYSANAPWFVGGGEFDEEDYVDAVTVSEDKLLKTLGVVYEGKPGFEKCLPKKRH